MWGQENTLRHAELFQRPTFKKTHRFFAEKWQMFCGYGCISCQWDWDLFHLTFGLILIDVSYGYLLISSNSQVADGSEGKLVSSQNTPATLCVWDWNYESIVQFLQGRCKICSLNVDSQGAQLSVYKKCQESTSIFGFHVDFPRCIRFLLLRQASGV